MSQGHHYDRSMVGAGGRWRVLLAAAAGALVVVFVLLAAPASAQDDGSTSSSTTPPPTTAAPNAGAATVTGPIAADAGTKGRPITAATEDLAAVGYEEQELFLAGTAVIHGQRGPWDVDGKWSTTEVGERDYRTRLLVRRPTDPARFSGTVYVSWLNVTGAFDNDPEWAQAGAEVVRQGAAWIGISAQALGIDGPLGARRWDPPRYGSLSMPGDGASYDIFTQAAEAIRSPGAVDPLAGLDAERRLIATGQAQSAQRLVTYINAFQPSTHAFDGFLLLSRFRGAAPIGSAALPPAQAVDPDGSSGRPYLPDPLAALLAGPPLAKVRSDTDVPVFTVLTETESRQARRSTSPDGEHSRTWEVAGSSHLDTAATAAIRARLKRDFPDVPLDQLECKQPNDLPTRYALRAALRGLADWVDEGDPPPVAPPLERDDESGAVLRDPDGNAKGGVRLPQLAVPTARYSGESTAEGYCELTGSAVAFTEAQLARRYPTPDAYADDFTDAVEAAVDAGYLLPEDATDLLAGAPVPGIDATVASIAGGRGSTGDGGSDAASGSGASGSAGTGGTGDGSGATATAQSAGKAHGWMATTGRDLLTPLLGGLLLLLNGRVVMTVARQRRRSGAG